MVDSCGGLAAHEGGAFSGKNAALVSLILQSRFVRSHQLTITSTLLISPGENRCGARIGESGKKIILAVTTLKNPESIFIFSGTY